MKLPGHNAESSLAKLAAENAARRAKRIPPAEAVALAMQALPPVTTNDPARIIERHEIMQARDKLRRPAGRVASESKVDKSLALRKGIERLNSEASNVLDRVVGYANSPDSPHHEWALKLLAERVLPAGLFKAIGEQMIDGGKVRTGGISITINSAAPTVEAGRTIEHDDGTSDGDAYERQSLAELLGADGQ